MPAIMFVFLTDGVLDSGVIGIQLLAESSVVIIHSAGDGDDRLTTKHQEAGIIFPQVITDILTILSQPRICSNGSSCSAVDAELVDTKDLTGADILGGILPDDCVRHFNVAQLGADSYSTVVDVSGNGSHGQIVLGELRPRQDIVRDLNDLNTVAVYVRRGNSRTIGTLKHCGVLIADRRRPVCQNGIYTESDSSTGDYSHDGQDNLLHKTLERAYRHHTGSSSITGGYGRLTLFLLLTFPLLLGFQTLLLLPLQLTPVRGVSRT